MEMVEMVEMGEMGEPGGSMRQTARRLLPAAGARRDGSIYTRIAALSGSLQHVIADGTAAAAPLQRVWLYHAGCLRPGFPRPQQQVTRVR